MKKNDRRSGKKGRRQNLRETTGKRSLIAVVAIACAIVLFGCIAIFAIIRGNTTVIGFYDIPKEYVSAIESLSTKDPLPKARFVVLSDKDALSTRLSRKVDVLVTWNGALTGDLSAKAKAISPSVRARFPSSITSSPFYAVRSESGAAEFRVMPIALDHFETSYFTVLQKRTGQKYPETLSQLEAYAAGCKTLIENPLICAGANDDNLYGLISVIIESLAGQAGYVDFVARMKAMEKTDGIDRLLSLPVGGDAPSGTTFAAVLGRIKRWQQRSLILPEWYKAGERVVSVTMEDNHAAVVFMSLREHREKPFPAIKYFQANQFPPETGKSRAVVEPSVCAMVFRATEPARVFLARLSSEAGQEALSSATKLGPATLRGEAFDVQADDARYFAAATPGGPVPDIGRAAFKDKARRSAIAAGIRAYLSGN